MRMTEKQQKLFRKIMHWIVIETEIFRALRLYSNQQNDSQKVFDQKLADIVNRIGSSTVMYGSWKPVSLNVIQKYRNQFRYDYRQQEKKQAKSKLSTNQQIVQNKTDIGNALDELEQLLREIEPIRKPGMPSIIDLIKQSTSKK